MLITLLILWAVAGPLLLAEFEKVGGIQQVKLKLALDNSKGWLRTFTAGPAIWLFVLYAWIQRLISSE